MGKNEFHTCNLPEIQHSNRPSPIRLQQNPFHFRFRNIMNSPLKNDLIPSCHKKARITICFSLSDLFIFALRWNSRRDQDSANQGTVQSLQIIQTSGSSSVGRAQPCQGWGREFESRLPLIRAQLPIGSSYWMMFDSPILLRLPFVHCF